MIQIITTFQYMYNAFRKTRLHGTVRVKRRKQASSCGQCLMLDEPQARRKGPELVKERCQIKCEL